MRTGPEITFSPGSLGEDPVRIPVLAIEENWYAVAKPAGIAVTSTVAPPGVPGLAGAIRESIARGKSQLTRLGIHRADVIYDLDDEATGGVLFANRPEATGWLRNELGSGRFEFTYRLIGREADDGMLADDFECHLPLAAVRSDWRAVVSHQRGKKCSTRFSRLARGPHHSVWLVRTNDCRFHQIRVHAMESGVHILGESIYLHGEPSPAGWSTPAEDLAAEKERDRGRAPLFVHLEAVRFPSLDGRTVEVRVPLPRYFEAEIRRLGRRSRGR